jgi:hypothetical protein
VKKILHGLTRQMTAQMWSKHDGSLAARTLPLLHLHPCYTPNRCFAINAVLQCYTLATCQCYKTEGGLRA